MGYLGTISMAQINDGFAKLHVLAMTCVLLIASPVYADL
jgi:hypothetical protein